MKMSEGDYRKLRAALFITLELSGVQKKNFNSTLMLWQLFHRAAFAGRININELYREYNDSHIETALKRFHNEADAEAVI